MVSSSDPADSPSKHVVDIDGGRPSEVLVATVAALAKTDAASLPPLYDVIDPEALDALYEHVRTRTVGEANGYRVTFPYEGYEVCVEFDGRIRLATP
ncbi:HalOD1 output domain-containing protein [Halostagnicola kamekurae]|uniref:Halobacterial output domain-containing protein n=1 Tax=Halostagnicola kamekurae TaxID=619731 RepID=A0A1I6P0B7_9EURY|nr:HalOD1 output domain-containing protein [Halostagnicola kamekurae]SFS33642.1 hypothetical protein SAMN04488556_0242 [Halostagnicola kamekurae]